MSDDPKAPKAAKKEKDKSGKAEKEEAVVAAEPGFARYQNIWLFGGALVVLALLFVLVLMQFPDRLILQNILLAALLSTTITGLLGGIGVFKGTWGSVGGAAAILLGMFVTFEGAEILNIRSDMDEMETKLNDASDELSALKTTHQQTLENLVAATAKLNAVQNLSNGLEVVVYCRKAQHRHDLFLVSEPDPLAVGDLQAMELPAVLSPTQKAQRVIQLYVAERRAEEFRTPAVTRIGRGSGPQIPLGADPAFTIIIQRGKFDLETFTMGNTKIAIQVHDYEALNKCSDEELARQ